MYALSIVGSSARETATDIAGVVSGNVALVTTGETATPPSAVTTVTTFGDGRQATSDDSQPLGEILDRLARSHDYALVVDVPEADLPQLVLDGSPSRLSLFDESVTDPDAERVVDALHEQPEHESLESLVAAVKRSDDADRAGAIATFTGRVRRFDGPDDVETTHLDFEMYDAVAHAKMRELETELEAREEVFDVRLHHRQGYIPAGGDIVFVVVLAGHRREAFDAVSDGIDRLKREVPIFKREQTTDEQFWVDSDG